MSINSSNKFIFVLNPKIRIIIDWKPYPNNEDKVNSKEIFNKSPFFTSKDFNEKLINLINSVYDKDFKLLNYDKIETK